MSWRAAALAGVVAACRSRVDDVTPVESMAPPAPVSPPIVIGTGDGIFEVSDAGVLGRRISATPAEHPRWTTDHRALLFVTPWHDLRRVDVASGTEHSIAVLPASIAACPGTTIDITKLRVQADDDVVLDHAGAVMCVRVQDRNLQMMDISVAFTVRIATRAVDATAVWSACSPRSVSPPAACTTQLATGAAVDAPPLPGDAVVPDGYHVESVSPSRRWALVGGHLQVGDYIDRDLFVLDRERGALYAVQDTAATWPAPLTAGELRQLPSVPTLGAVGETPIVWLAPSDRVVVGHALITPGERVVQLAGDLAR